MAYCEDYPCCGHTPQDPCDRQPYDEPGYFDTRKNPHALCNHEEGECNVDDYEDEEEDDEDWKRKAIEADIAAIPELFGMEQIYPENLPIHRTEANYGVVCSTCDGGGCLDCTDPA